MALFKNLFGVATALLIFGRLAMSLAITPALSLNALESNGSLSADPRRCTDSSSWMGEGYHAGDCAAAIHLLFQTEVRSAPLQIREFYAMGKTPSPGHPVVETPKRYVKGTCTVAVVMLEFFAEGGMNLPDQPQYLPVRGADLSTWQSVWGGVLRIQQRCGAQSTMGWETAGFERGIGVFMWSTGSAMDRSVP